MSRLTWVPDQRLRFDFGYGTVTLYGPTFQTARLSKLHSRVIPTGPRNPRSTRVDPVWANPLSLATTHGIAACFLFLRVLRCFTSPGSLPAAMDSPQDAAVLPAAGFPIRTSTDRSLVGGSPWLFAATHDLHRLLEPRHPPHALSSLVTQDSDLSSELEGHRVEVKAQALVGHEPRKDQLVDAFLPFVFGCQSASATRAASAARRDARSRGSWWS